MGSLQFITIFILFIVMSIFCQEEDPFKEVRNINPIMRYWVQSRLRKKLPMLETLATRKKDTDSQKYRNCYFSPVQCQLPVFINIDTLANAIKPDLQQDVYPRFRRHRK